MDWLIDPLSETFMQRVLVGSALAVMTASLIGTWVVLRGLSFMGDALAHGVTPGIALAFALGFNLKLGAIAAAGAMTLGINVVHRKARLREDTGIGLLFVGMLAMGVIIMSRLPSFSSSLATILFGDTLGIRKEDVVLQAVAAGVTLVVILIFYRAFLVLSFNQEKAKMLGLRPGLAHLVMLSLLTLAIVTSFRTVGTLLVFALIVAPPATASLVVRRVPTMMVAGVAFGFLAVISGLLISWHANTAAGATMAGMSVAIFFLVLALREVRNMKIFGSRPRLLERTSYLVPRTATTLEVEGASETRILKPATCNLKPSRTGPDSPEASTMRRPWGNIATTAT